MRSQARPVFFQILCLMLLLVTFSQVQSRPELIREGISYYSNEFLQTGIVRDLGADKNLEEVYQFYTYYEAVYDSIGRVIIFKEYKQGNVILEEQYIYDDEGSAPVEKTVLLPGQEPEVIRLNKSN